MSHEPRENELRLDLIGIRACHVQVHIAQGQRAHPHMIQCGYKVPRTHVTGAVQLVTAKRNVDGYGKVGIVVLLSRGLNFFAKQIALPVAYNHCVQCGNSHPRNDMAIHG